MRRWGVLGMSFSYGVVKAIETSVAPARTRPWRKMEGHLACMHVVSDSWIDDRAAIHSSLARQHRSYSTIYTPWEEMINGAKTSSYIYAPRAPWPPMQVR